MPSRRTQIAMTDEEQQAFLEQGWTLEVASNGPRGWPHLVAMWYAMLDGKIHFTTFTKSQKIRNLRRDPKITCLLEAGEAYEELRGLVIEGEAEVIGDDPDLVLRVMAAVGRKRDGGGDGEGSGALPSDVQRRQAAKRSVVRVHPVRVYSWDHRKLGGVY